MAPIASADLESTSEHVEFVSTDSDVFPPLNADMRLKKLWTQHGDVQSLTYSNPELTSFSSLVNYNARNRPDEVAYLVPRDDTFVSITWQQFDHLTEYAAAQYSLSFRGEIENGTSTQSQPTIALLGSGNTFRYWVSEIALLKLGVRVLLLSDKNADVARDHLLKTCNAVGIVVEQKYLVSVQDIQIPRVPLVPVALTWDPKSIEPFIRFESDDVWNQQAMIIHSSGSTGLPKPIIHTNRSMMLIARMYRLFQSFIVENWYLCFPLFHIAGVSIILGGIPSGLPTTFPPEAWPPSPGAILTAWRKLENLGRPVDCVHCAPSVIEDLYEYLSLSPEKDYSPLIKLKILQPGGAALSQVVLQKLVDLGVNVKTTYGSTEIGPPFRTIPDTIQGSCYKIKYLFPNDPHVVMEPQGENIYECVVYKGFPLAAELWLQPGAPNPYRTNDLFIEDPPGSGLFTLQGRKDDMLIHSNGENTNALPLQMAIEECHPDIHKVVVFGSGKPCTSAILELTKSSSVDREQIFGAIDKACAGFPAFSRLDRSLISVLSDDETLPVTPKGNVRRNEAQKLYGERLEALYTTVFNSTETSQEDNDTKHLNDIEFVRSCVAGACGITVDEVLDTTSFYNIGLDSQKAVRLRSRLAERFGTFPLMLVFEYPSPRGLCEYFSGPEKSNGSATTRKNASWIQEAISRYNSEIASWAIQPSPPLANHDSGETVYLTGATGALGNALLACFEVDSKVSKVYCAIRGSNAKERLAQSLRERGYGSEIYTSSKFIAVPYDMKDPNLGLDASTYQILASQVTSVVHNAWKMDFNQQVDMFEDDCLRGTLNLMRFAHQSTRKTFAFTSSVATNMGVSAIGKVIPESAIPNNVSLSLETGYAQSKFIVEIISQTYATTLNIPVRICRVGQLCGHSTLGSWNTSEMFPIMMSTGLNHLLAMPMFEKQSVNWLPVDICAESIRTILIKSVSETYTLHNLVNPSTVSWSAFLDSLQHASGVGFERVSMREWVEKLEKLCEDEGGAAAAVVVPGAKLLGFFEAMVESADEGEACFDNKKTAALVPRLRESKSVGTELLRLYLERWREVGFI